jgi:DNA-binding Lrp family transcriptional regulator
MINWRSTTTHHAVRRSLGLSNDEYCLLDWMYHTQGNEKYGHNGWCEVPYQDIADLLGISKGGAFKMVDRMEGKGLIEVNTANTKQKRVTSKFSLPVYFDVKEDEEVGAVIVQKVNAGNESVHLVNGERSLSERNRSLSERQIKINKEKEESNTLTISASAENLNWMEVARLMFNYSKSEGADQWRFMCEAQGYKGDGMSVFSAWASKQSAYTLKEWKAHFPKIQTWLKTDARADHRAAKPAYQPKPEPQVPE